MSARRTTAIVAACAATAAALVWWPGAGDAPPRAATDVLADHPPAPTTAAMTGQWLPRRAEPVAFLTDRKSDRPHHRKSGYPPGTRIEVRDLPKVRDGIFLPDGTVLPYLNGMTWAPAVQRGPQFGPFPPVVALVVDYEGFEWWEHADGSTTTTRYKEVTAHGETYWDPGAEHAATVPSRLVRIAPQS